MINIDECIKEECKDLKIDNNVFNELDKKSFVQICDKNITKNKYIEIIRERRNLMLINNYSLEEASKKLNEIYKLNDILDINLLMKEIIYLIYYIYFINTNTNIPLGFRKFYEDNKEFKEKSYIRIKCLKEGWKDDTIEKLLNRYYNSNIIIKDKKYIKNIYKCLRYILKLEDNLNNIPIPKGRPKLNEIVKKILNKYLIKKAIKRVQTYKRKAEIFDKLFNEKDIKDIKELTNSSALSETRKEEIINKLSIFEKFVKNK